MVAGIPAYSNSVTAQAATIKINKKKVTLKQGKTVKLKIKGTKKKVKWSSSKKAVATVSKKGVVKAKKPGKAIITAKIGKKKYKCKVTVKKKTNKTTKTPKTIQYGSVSGNVTYYYNKFIGHRGDTGAVVVLIPKDGKAKNLNTTDSMIYQSNSENYKKYGVYTTKVDGAGQYALQNIPTGNYIAVIVSKETTSGGWFDDEQNYYNGIRNEVSAYLSSSMTEAVVETVSFHKYTVSNITIRNNYNTILSYDFGTTYI